MKLTVLLDMSVRFLSDKLWTRFRLVGTSRFGGRATVPRFLSMTVPP
jgi:hypothetical protein